MPAELQAAIRKGIAVNVFAHEAARDLVLLQNNPLPLERERQLPADVAFVAQAKDIAQPARFDVHGPVQVVRTARNLCKLGVMAFHEDRQEGVGGVHVRDSSQPELLDQPVLQCAV